MIFLSCLFNQIDDMSLRDNATHTLVTMVKQFSHVTYDQNDFRDLISNGLVHEIKAGFRSKKEVRIESYICAKVQEIENLLMSKTEKYIELL